MQQYYYHYYFEPAYDELSEDEHVVYITTKEFFDDAGYLSDQGSSHQFSDDATDTDKEFDAFMETLGDKHGFHEGSESRWEAYGENITGVLKALEEHPNFEKNESYSQMCES